MLFVYVAKPPSFVKLVDAFCLTEEDPLILLAMIHDLLEKLPMLLVRLVFPSKSKKMLLSHRPM